MKIIPKRKLHYPFAMECDYTKLLTGYVKDCMSVVRRYIPEMRKLVAEQSEPGATSVNVYLALLIDRIRHDMPQAEALEGRMRRFFDDVAHFTWRDLKRLLERVTGTQISDRGARLPRKDVDDDLDALKEIWVGENLDLIRSIDDETMRRIRQALTARITGSVNHARLAKDLIAEIQAITEKEKRRAELIARDQLGKLHGQINRRKQESLGIDEYEWETSHDERVRDSHKALQGKVFSWSKPPPEGHPGYPIRCRCIALPVIDWDRQLGEPKKGSYLEIPEKIDGGIGQYAASGTTPEMEKLFRRYLNDEHVKIDTSYKKVAAYDLMEDRVILNPQHRDFVKYNLSEVLTHELVHKIDVEQGIAVRLAEPLDRAIRGARSLILANAEKYEALMDSPLGEDMSISDLFAAITGNRIRGEAAHPMAYWRNIGAVEREVIANIMTICYTRNKKGLELICSIPPLWALLKELEAAYDVSHG